MLLTRRTFNCEHKYVYSKNVIEQNKQIGSLKRYVQYQLELCHQAWRQREWQVQWQRWRGVPDRQFYHH